MNRDTIYSVVIKICPDNKKTFAVKKRWKTVIFYFSQNLDDEWAWIEYECQIEQDGNKTHCTLDASHDAAISLSCGKLLLVQSDATENSCLSFALAVYWSRASQALLFATPF